MKKSVAGPIIGVIIVTLIIIFSSYKNQEKYAEDWLICTYPEKYENYTETLKFRFYVDVIMGYYREEVLETKDKKELEERYNYFLDVEADLSENKNFAYDVKKEDLSVKINTFINVLEMPEFFNTYMEELKIVDTDGMNAVKLELEELDYTCEIVKKRG